MKQIIFKSRKILYILFLCISAFAMGNEQLCRDDKNLDSRTELVTKEESTTIEHVLEHMIIQAQERNEDPSELVVRCYQACIENKNISPDDLNALLPLMMECIKEEQIRATRPDSPGIGNGAISGCCGCCDFSQILAILNSIQAKLVIINNLIIQCCDEIRFDFQATWSILANLNVTATVDLNPVFSVINECCNGTFSTLANLSFTAVVDLNPVFTAINACCNSTFSMLEKIDREVIGTFSVINACCNGTFTAINACCNSTFSMLEKIDREVIGTFSVINACCNGTFSVLANLTLTATADLSGVFTALNACCNGTFSAIADIKSSLTAITVNFNPVFTALNACCNSTFSMLDKIDREVIGTFSVINACCNGTFTAINACCNSTFSMLEKIDREVIGTFSVINACCNGTFSVLANLTVTATADLSGVFTALNACCNGTFSAIADIKSSLTAITVNFNPVFTALNACCNSTFSMLDKIDREVIGTFSVINACCNGTFSVLANLTVTATADLSGVFSALNACCDGTFSVLANLTVTATADLSGVFSALAACCDGTFSSLFDIKNTLTVCGAIPIFTATNITASGNYCLANDVIGTITISSNEVHLDLNGFSVISPTMVPAIIVGPNIVFLGTISMSNVENVSIRNGQLYNQGIVMTTCTNILIDSITSYSCVGLTSDIRGVGIEGLAIRNYSVFNRSDGTPVTISESRNITIENFDVNNSQYVQGFNLDSTDGCQITNVFLGNSGISASSSLISFNISNLSFKNVMSQAGRIQVTTGTGITIENIQMAGSTNNLAILSNIRDVTIVDCTYLDSEAPGLAVCSIATGTNIVIRNLNVENCSTAVLLSLVPAIDVIVENVSASECIFSSAAISANNSAFGENVAQLAFNNVVINNCTLPTAINLSAVSDVGVSRFKVTHNTSTTNPISFATINGAPKVFIDDCIFSDNSSTVVTEGTIISATDSDATRINNVVIEKNTYAGSQNGIVLQSLLLTVSAAEITNCRIENNSIAGDGLPECNLIQVSGIANSTIAHNNISGNAITRGDFGTAATFHGIFNTGSINAIIKENTLVGNLWTGSVESNLIQTSTISSIEYNTIIGNVVGSDLFGINAVSVDHAIIRGNVVNFNRCGATAIATGAGTAVAIEASGADVVVEKNILNNNTGTGGGSIGLSVAGTSMVTMNEAQGHTQDYQTSGGLVIPIAQLSYTNGIIVPIPSNAPLSSYHNLTMVTGTLTLPCDVCGVYTVLANLSITATVDFSPVFTALNACCNGTFSVLANLNLNLSPVFTQVAAGFNGTFTALASCCNGTFSSLADLRSSLTCQAAPITAPTNIVVSGPYCLQNDIVGTITVSANNVSINMNSRRVLNGGIQVSGVRNINIFNGVIDNGNGALVSSSTAVTFDHVEIVNVAGPSGVAINIVNSDDVLFNQDTIHALTGQLFINTSTGARFVNCDIFDNTITGTIVNILRAGGAQITGCRLFNNSSQDTVGMASSSNTIVQNCNFHDNAITGSIIASAGSNNTTLIDSCILYNNRSTAGFIGVGIASTDGGTAVQGCDINGNRAATGIFSAIFNAGSSSTIRSNLIRNNILTGGTSFSISDHTNPFTATIIGNQADNGSATNYDVSPGAILTASLIKTTATLMVPATTFHNLLLLP